MEERFTVRQDQVAGKQHVATSRLSRRDGGDAAAPVGVIADVRRSAECHLADGAPSALPDGHVVAPKEREPSSRDV